jgi:hypothetical protein
MSPRSPRAPPLHYHPTNAQEPSSVLLLATRKSM